LLGYCEGIASAEERARVEAHLRECDLCRRRHERLARQVEVARGLPEALLGEARGGAEAEAARRALAGRLRRAEEVRVEAEEGGVDVRQLLAEIDAMPPEERELRVANQARYASTALAAALIERSLAENARDIDATLAYAKLGVAAALAAAASRDSPSSNDCLARCWAQLANAERQRGNIAEAGRVLTTAFSFLERGTGDLALRALLERLRGSLTRARRLYDEAADEFRSAIAICRQIGDVESEASALINLAITYIYAGEAEAAIAPLQRCQEIVDLQQHPRLRWAANIALVRCYLDLAEPRRAHALWHESESLFADCQDELILLRRQWLLGWSERELGELQAAEIRLREVRDGFVQHGLRMESALVSLDLASIYLRQRRPADVVRTVREIIPICQSLGWNQELLASLRQLAAAARDMAAGLRLVKQISQTVERGLDGPIGSAPPRS
jgi:tetratricopeptide (TPR) repeat protein